MRNALFTRYGEPNNLNEYSLKSQILQLETTKAMFEAFGRNKYNASGIIYWMFNSAWPTLYWQFFDYFYTPNGAFYGAKKACEPLHIQYAYDDNSIYLINNLYKNYDNLKVNIKVHDFHMNKKLDYSLQTDINSDSVKKIYTLNNVSELTSIYFVNLELFDKDNSLLSDNFYWLSKNGDDQADFSELMNLSPLKLDVSYKIQKDNDIVSVDIVLANKTKYLAFAVNPKIIDSVNNELITPIYWEDNYFAMLPNEQKHLRVKFYNDKTRYTAHKFIINGWNIEELSFDLK
jgi:exo-1,4-beta-D-glucosaminidase